jgi:4-amino-4-deoxy-L-arabinose transferase-like glycosyltransferase
VSATFQTSAPPKSTVRARTALVLIIAAWALVYIPGLFSPALLDDADSVHAEAAREILARHDWVTLHANGVRYLEKAPLMYWAIAASFAAFGIGEWQARLPLALAALWLALATWRLGRRVYSDEAGLFAALAVTTAIGPYIFTRFLIPDLLVGLWLLLTFGFFLRAVNEERPSRTACWGMAAASALNVLTKGLIGLVFPAAVIFLYVLLARGFHPTKPKAGLAGTPDWRRLLRLRWLSSVAVFLAIAAPWHVLAGLRNPAQGPPGHEVRGFFWFYFVNEHFLRYLNKRVPRDYDTVPLLLFWALLLVWAFPWSAWLPQAVRTVFHRRDAEGAENRWPANVVFALWAVVIVGFFSFSTRQEYYVLPAVPALALLVGGYLGREETGHAPSLLRRDAPAIALLVIAALVFAATVALALTSRTPPPGSDIADLLTKNPEQYALSFGHIFDLTPQALGAFRVPLLGLGASLFGGALACWWLRRRGRHLAAIVALAAGMVAMLNFVHAGLVTFSPVLTSKPLALAVAQRFQTGDVIVIDGDYEDGSTLNFYTRQPVRVLNHREANLWYGSFFPDAPRVFETDETLLALWRGPQRVFLWSQTAQPKLLAPERVLTVARSGGKFILSNRLD